jgi:type I restriction enzyme, S subunit
MSLNLDKSTWSRVSLGQIARHITDRVDPETSGLERFLAGEHIPSGSLAITDWGVIGRDPVGPMFYKRFKPGHVLYVSRRTYLRKVAVPDFEGITGEKTFVLESIDTGTLLQRFLPFVVSAEVFHEYAIRNSRGSVNPYLNWGELALYEFDLPPLDEQKRIADLLWAMERHRRSLSALAAVLTGGQLRDPDTARTALLNDLLERTDSTWTVAPLGEIGTFVRGRRFTRSDYVDRGIGCIHYGQIYTDFAEVGTEPVTYLPEALRASLRFARTGDVIVAATSEDVQDVCKAMAWMGDEEVAVHDDCFIFRSELEPRFASYVFASETFQRQKSRFVSESKVVRVAARHLQQIVIPVPPRSAQTAIADAIDEVTQARRQLADEEVSAATTQKALGSYIFGGI